ncbi:putative cyclophilin type peptidyl-prolyl cis-trans isomerase [Trypanosoma grayi]|uniref:putative cyclophilin type peptidyl-prolyl cis-trans isomerase n=1 Tax=Trypanosoma grayi TaxID=71804 RepID=UPI0004F41EFD|nr:putative cyclophilin type peptidyl-prolyl cis-trans isomerase [Trypanosoma grayi]KEG07933.1 putative cyclophilin type peptidyl-prolyl cis-trans isomerase [Trypanosoma grayi]
MRFALSDDEVCVVELHTSEGVITLELYYREAVCAAESFLRLAESGQLDGAMFSRMVPGFVLECSLGDKRAYGELIEAEENKGLHHTGAGIISCPRVGGNGVAGATFFVTLGPQPHLDKTCTVFGRVYSGMRVVEKISQFRVASDTFRLYSPVVILRCAVRVLPKEQRPPSSLTIPAAAAQHPPKRCKGRTSVLDGLE